MHVKYSYVATFGKHPRNKICFWWSACMVLQYDFGMFRAVEEGSSARASFSCKPEPRAMRCNCCLTNRPAVKYRWLVLILMRWRHVGKKRPRSLPVPSHGKAMPRRFSLISLLSHLDFQEGSIPQFCLIFIYTGFSCNQTQQFNSSTYILTLLPPTSVHPS